MIFKAPPLGPDEKRVIAQIEDLKGKLRHIVREPEIWMGLLRRAAFARAIRGSNSIEGYNVSVDDAIAAAEAEEPLEATEINWQAVWQYRQAMTYVIQLAEDPNFNYSGDLIKSLHFMMLSYDLSKHPGRYRPGAIHIYSTEAEEIVYEGPDADLVPSLVEELMEYLRREDNEHYIIKAALAHLNLTLIHPFKDGNGRMARCLQTLVLSQSGMLAPQFSSIEEYLGKNTNEYYAALETVARGGWNPENVTKTWIRFCLTAHYRQAMTVLRRTKELSETWGGLERLIVRKKLMKRMIFALADASSRLRVRNGTYRKVAEISSQSASRDLKELVDTGLLIPKGERRGRFYIASEEVLKTTEQIKSKFKKVRDPFEPVQNTMFTEV